MQRTELEIARGGTHYLRNYENIGELAGQAEESLRTGSASTCASQEPDSEFSQTRSLDKAIDLMRFGWPKGTKAAQKLLDTVDIHEITAMFPERPVLDVYYDVAGDEPDIDRFLTNDPENMRNIIPITETIGTIATILVNCAQHAYVEADIMRRRGVVVLGLIEAITSLGYGVNVEAYDYSSPSVDRPSSDMYELRVPLLEAGAAVDRDTLAFAIAHPSFLRRIIFAAQETEPKKIRDRFGFWPSGGYGVPHDLKRAAYEGTGVIHIGKDQALCESDKQMTKELNKLLKKLFSQEAAIEQS